MFTKDQLITTFQKVATEVAEKQFPSLKGETVIADLGIDSLAMLEIVGAMEREFKIQIPDDQLVGLQTINDLVGLVERRLNPAA
jgi:acyl carrier protein